MGARILAVGLSLACMLSPVLAIAEPEAVAPATVTREDGGPLRETFFGSTVYPHSGVHRVFTTVHDARLPIRIEGDTGARLKREDQSILLAAQVRLRAVEPIVAAEVRFLMFDAFGRHIRTLSFTAVEDLPVGTVTFTPSWSTGNRGIFLEYCNCIAYVARARAASGAVFEADLTPVFAEALRFSPKPLDQSALKLQNPPEDIAYSPNTLPTETKAK